MRVLISISGRSHSYGVVRDAAIGVSILDDRDRLHGAPLMHGCNRVASLVLGGGLDLAHLQTP